MGAKCSCRLTLSPVDFGDKLAPSLLKSVLRLVALERGSVEIEGALSVDCTLTIKSIQGL